MAPTDLFYPDAEQSEQQKQRRERHFHVIEIPSLRLMGFSIMTLLVVLRQHFVPDEPGSRPFILGTMVLAYSLASWVVLYLYFETVKRVHLGTLFLSLDVAQEIRRVLLNHRRCG